MRKRLELLALAARARGKPAIDKAAGLAVAGLLRGLRRTDADRMAAFGGGLLRRVGPWLPEHRVGRANLVAAYPEKSASEIEAILGGVWENLGRVSAEYAHLDRLWDFDPAAAGTGRIEIPPDTIARFEQLRDDGRPALLFAAHIGNWELPAVAAAAQGLETTIVYRRPSLADVAQAIQSIRSVGMGTLVPTSPEAPLRAASALERGSHVGMLVDQHFTRGVDVMFFGRRCKANPMLARLARHFDCPIHGARAVRLPGGRFRVELTPALAPPRDARGVVDVTATMQAITSVVEGWVREHPEQWLWLHRRWR